MAERLFPNEFPLRMKLFDVLVKPIILYAAEITGFDRCDQYERI